MRRFLALWLCVMATGTLAACEGVKISDKDIAQVQTRQVRQALSDSRREHTLVLDPRSPRAFTQAHIAGAVNIPYEKIMAGHPALVAAKQIIVYGRNAMDPISAAAVKKMLALGYGNVLDFRGGLEAWQAAGGHVAAATSPSTSPSTSPTPAR